MASAHCGLFFCIVGGTSRMSFANTTFKSSAAWYVRIDGTGHRQSVSPFQLLDKLESKMEGTTMEGIIPSLFQGQYVVSSISHSADRCTDKLRNSIVSFQQYIRCTKVDHESRVKQTFYDVPLQVRNSANSKQLRAIQPSNSASPSRSYGEFPRFLQERSINR